MKKGKILRNYLYVLIVIAVFVVASIVINSTGFTFAFASGWSLVPPVIAIVLALITKEVYSSLFIGIVTGALLYSSFNFEVALTSIFEFGFVAKLADSWNVGILIFLVILGIIVCLVNKAGGSAAYGRWASGALKSKGSAQAATFGLGVLIFVDDYFNCLTVGSVMRPVTDKKLISRAKLAYLIDATAAPICMIAPVSSWAAAVTGMVEGVDGFKLFISAIPYNFYSLGTILMVILMICMKFDYGPMRKYEKKAAAGDVVGTEDDPFKGEVEDDSKKGKTIDLVLPVLVLIACCILGMTYTGGLFAGESLINAFANCDAALGLSLGSLVALLLIFVIYIPRGVLTFKEFTDCISEGFKAMVAPILILTFAWSLSGITGQLGAAEFVAGIVEGSAAGLQMMLPAIIFAIAVALSFSTGTSWGTFGILIPIIVAASASLSGNLLTISISACLAGAVCGDHCSPISDTTIMASSGARCNHVMHVSTQLPYVITVAAVSFVGYIVAGFVQSVWVALPVTLILLAATLFVIRAIVRKKEAKEPASV